MPILKNAKHFEEFMRSRGKVKIEIYGIEHKSALRGSRSSGSRSIYQYRITLEKKEIGRYKEVFDGGAALVSQTYDGHIPRAEQPEFSLRYVFNTDERVFLINCKNGSS